VVVKKNRSEDCDVIRVLHSECENVAFVMSSAFMCASLASERLSGCYSYLVLNNVLVMGEYVLSCSKNWEPSDGT
jgi:hypothetical protein